MDIRQDIIDVESGRIVENCSLETCDVPSPPTACSSSGSVPCSIPFFVGRRLPGPFFSLCFHYASSCWSRQERQIGAKTPLPPQPQATEGL
ncbi:MAG: hypothetical protein WBO82_04145 [Neisseria sp.]